MKNLLFLFLFMFLSCKKESDNQCGTCYYRLITTNPNGTLVSDKPYGSAFSVCGHDNLEHYLHYSQVLPDSTAAGVNYKVVCSCQ